jgi:hypothetical protein
MRAIIETRFSLFRPESPAWRASNGTAFNSPDEYREYLFSPARLDLRTEIFVSEGLPQLAAAIGDHHVHRVVRYSAELPGSYQAALKDAASQYPFLVLEEHGGASLPPTRAHLIRTLVPQYDSESSLFGLIRLDDDDLLPVGFFDRAEEHVSSEHVRWVLSFPLGITAIRLAGRYYDLRESYSPMIAAGLVKICSLEPDGSILQPNETSHNKADRSNPVILDARSPGYFWSRHPHQDTQLGKSETLSETFMALRRSMTRFPPIDDADSVRRLFPSLSPRLAMGEPDLTEGSVLLKRPI